MKGLFLGFALAWQQVLGKEEMLWTINRDVSNRFDRSMMRNQRLAGVESAAFVEFSSRVAHSLAEGKEFGFEINTRDAVESKSCILSEGNPLVPAALMKKYPQLKHFRCDTRDGEHLQLTVNLEEVDGMSGVFYDVNGASYFIDSAVKSSDKYLIYNAKEARRQGTKPEFHDDVIRTDASELPKTNLKKRTAMSRVSTEAFKFKLVVAANKQFSSYHGNTAASVLAAVVTTFTRVNGVYTHEFGAYLELVDNADDALCHASGPSGCSSLSNSGSILNQVTSFLNGVGITESSYDVGHAVTTGSGGVARYPSLCVNGIKARGTTGLGQPETDVFYIDYVAHEMGHQFLGAHAFRDCAGSSDGNLMIEGAVEPGSASTIMGYAGICGSNDIQDHSDPYFNNLNQQQMYDYVLSVQNDGVCGQSFSLGNTLPTVSAPNSCAVPIGNSFQLKGSSNSAAGTTFFSWDRVDTAIEDFSSTTIGKFRSWKPTKSRSRFFPNLYFQNFNTNQNIELLPKNTKTMEFRFTERRLYSTPSTAASFSLSQMGDFVYTDTNVAFRSVNALSISSPSNGVTLRSGTQTTVSWTPAGLGSTVEILLARNTFVASSSFDYEEDNKELDWVLAATATMTSGQVTFTVPTLGSSSVDANLMIRSSSIADTEGCFFFDLLTDVTVNPADPNAPTPSPPTLSPTFPPVQGPTVPPPTTSPPTPPPTPFCIFFC